ncbi:P-loop NTPase domain-containing protein LPA1 homolog 1 [Zea mays]|uniref:p-loop NTPase domain-containing protein LPA1 homolog 1 n=1 Tax=Zea mays TaxID=4577 RepID=A0A1D6I064_MAIZE|nr:P-loop NTPase domain-containing protein LPA1 homolog 1 [Zea mays]ONM53673.1 P-loop NTPase domain-containing protein LPA1 homolog 1 [Zea mays]ONM53676.1 P-loop NTPase domain-containing protein LPA1 homolog 1 [Zea mays]
MAIINVDGCVSKAWPVESSGDGKRSSDNSNKNPIYGPLNICRAESVNLQFGTFGISACPTDTGCTSEAGNADESYANAAEGSSRHVLSSSGSPKKSDGHCKEIKESSAAYCSDEVEEEEADVRPNSGSDEDLSEEDNREVDDELLHCTLCSESHRKHIRGCLHDIWKGLSMRTATGPMRNMTTWPCWTVWRTAV